MKRLLLPIALLLLPFNGSTQGRDQLLISAGVTSIKEGFNQGMVFTGPQIAFRYARHWDVGSFRLSYEPNITLVSRNNRLCDRCGSDRFFGRPPCAKTQ